MNVNSTWFVTMFGQLIAQSPLLLIYVGGIVLCAVWWRRARGAVVWAVMGLGLMLLTSFGQTAVQAYLISSQMRGGMPVSQIGYMMSVLAIVGSLMRAGGIALLLVAVFAGRPRDEAAGFEVTMARAVQERF